MFKRNPDGSITVGMVKEKPVGAEQSAPTVTEPSEPKEPVKKPAKKSKSK